MELNAFLLQLNDKPDSVTFNHTITVIDSLYDFTPTSFRNGALLNEAGQNNGSCKLFSFARLHGLSQQQTLNCFGAYYRDDVLRHPDGSDHQNIRNFIKAGWAGIEFSGNALTPKKP
ncbi:HopJ type III effector protein [Sideroxydans lithotrophicus]|uniref:HopJ type III effector protein n=1 Tax=Sideroxydans lithotrophicus (strain ES-1) TaxID=580332 RepID=D5CLS9_SIDLE|nr:HopJ type III effector protein [Sideroxydans lithotrophicus]ADE12524.1 HopJ type III effector protein [Sideroxydans lithotrophicus ES-1]